MPEEINGQRYLTHPEAATYLHLTPTALYAMNTRKRGPARSRVGRRNLYAVRDLDAFIADRRIGGPAA